MIKQTLHILLILISAFSYAQETLPDLLKQHNKNTVPYISVEELAMPKTQAIILDARETQEFEVSHLKDAISVGYDFFNLQAVQEQFLEKDAQIVVYCSIGIRSEIIATKLKHAGYTNVSNLYGGIFEWKNKDFTVYDTSGNPTEKVHTFDKIWSRWLLKGIKVYDNKTKQ